MGFLQRRRERQDALVAQYNANNAALELAPRLERAIMTLAVHAQQIDDRLRGLEDRIIKTDSMIEQLPTQSDILSVRVHSAQVLTELAAVSLELRTEISSLRAPGAMSKPEPEEPEIVDEVITLNEELIILNDDGSATRTYTSTEPPSFLRPDVPDFGGIFGTTDEPISWGPHAR